MWDTNQALATLATEADGSGTTLREYAYGAGLDSFTTGAGSTYYDLADAFCSVANITSGGATRWTYSYDVFGNALTSTSREQNNFDDWQIIRHIADESKQVINWFGGCNW